MTAFSTLPILRGLHEVQPLLERLLEQEAFLCGGHARWMCSPHPNPVPSGDMDIYCQNTAIFNKMRLLLAEYGFNATHENEVSTTYAAPAAEDILRGNHPCHGDLRWSYYKLQLIQPQQNGQIVTDGDMFNVLSHFDFSVSRIGITRIAGIWTGYADPFFFDDEFSRRLRFQYIHCPLSSLYRALKYGRKGYHLPVSETLLLLNNWMERTPEYRERLTQLIRTEDVLTQEEIDELEALLRID